jgi:hypothetical protein
MVDIRMDFLADIVPDAGECRVMFHHAGIHDIGSATACFGDDLARIECTHGIYGWRMLTIAGKFIGELLPNATGVAIHVTPDTWMAGVGLLLPAQED